MKNSKNTLALLIAVIGLAILAFTYVYGIGYYKNQTEAVAAQNRSLKLEADALEMLYMSTPEYTKASTEMKAEFDSFKKGFVSDISVEDELMYMANMIEAHSEELMTVSYVNMGTPSVFAYAASPVATDPAFATGALTVPSVSDDGVCLYSYPIGYGFGVTYQGFKDMVHYLNTVGTEKKISGVSLAFDSSTGILSGIINVEEYALYGTDKPYNEITIPSVPLGVENIFGTIVIPEEDDTEEEGQKTNPKKD